MAVDKYKIIDMEEQKMLGSILVHISALQNIHNFVRLSAVMYQLIRNSQIQ